MEKQFDESLGGSEYVPPTIHVQKFAQARCQEILALNSALEQAQKGGLLFQRLPKAMRRRVMSHHSKRMPRRLREAHAKQLEKNGVPPKTKRPSRKFRRRPQNLLLEYNRRQRTFIWLETYIWHAKRFHMTEKWGYKLADFPNAKSFRACYRASANHCLLQDISYLCCIEINGPEDRLIEGLNFHVNTACGLTFGAKAYLNGCKEGSVTFFHKGKFPFGAIGTIQYLWKAEENSNAAHRTIWLWAHPSFSAEIIGCLIETFTLREEIVAEEIAQHSNSQLAGVLKQLDTHHVFDSPVKYTNAARHISVTLLKDKLNRFQLTGPLSHSILVDALHVTDLSQENCVPDMLTNNEVEVLNSDSESEDDRNHDDIVENIGKPSKNVHPWWKNYYKSCESKKSHLAQTTFWTSARGIYSPAQLPPHQVVALTILDPRYQLPPKRIKVTPESNVPGLHDVCSNISHKISFSPIWDSEVRRQATTNKLSNGELAKLRAKKYLVPGFSEDEINSAKNLNKSNTNVIEHSCIPALLVQRPGSQVPTKRLGFSSGWDVIIPAGWGMSLWMALIFRGARPGGLKQASTLEFESGAMRYMDMFAPDTSAGKTEANANKQNQADKYFRMPPNKRPNFIKLGIVSPLSCSWNVLINDWSQNKQKGDLSRPFYVLRDKVKLDALRSIINSYKRETNVNGSNRTDLISQFSNLFSNMNHDCLVPVKIESMNKGCPSDCSIICIPNTDDLEHKKTTPTFEGPVEPVHKDSSADERKALRNQHKKELKRLRKQRVSSNSKLKERMDMLLEKGESISHLINLKKDKAPTKEMVHKYAEEMKLLWIPEVKSVKDSCSRSVVGFVYKGDFSFTEAHGVGLGYIPLSAVVHLISVWTDKPIVLFRNPNTVQYRFAILKVY